MSIQSFWAPEKLYFKQGSLPVALRELTDVFNASRVLIVTDEEMLHNGRLELVTNVLHELGLDYGVNADSYACDCVILYGSPALWNKMPDDTTCIIIPTEPDMTDAFPWLGADMVILDEDVICGTAQKPQILRTARESLRGERASDYTLAWAVQAFRLVKNGGNLLHAAALAGLAKANAEPLTDDADLLPEAAEALGMTQAELNAFLNA